MDQIREYLSQNQDRFLDELIELLKIPSVSADSAFSQDVHIRSAMFLAPQSKMSLPSTLHMPLLLEDPWL